MNNDVFQRLVITIRPT